MEEKTQKDGIDKYLEKIEKLYITEESKRVLKKIIGYMKKYNEEIEKEYIPFDMCIYSNNKETLNNIVNLIGEAIKSFSYVKSKKEEKIMFALQDKIVGDLK